jgi:CheY-like chemotaxis protein
MKHAESKPSRLVMIADNDEEERCILKAILKLKGFNVVEAADGQEAINLATKATPDLLLVNLRLPRVSGLTVILETHADQGQVLLLFLVAQLSDDL